MADADDFESSFFGLLERNTEYQRWLLQQRRERLHRMLEEYENRQLFELCKSYWNYMNGHIVRRNNIGEM